ncbi:MAG TPA: 6-pyruvoyl-tetrahydropterin synthase-related protein, partial [Pyrinomonadaceae bacterium]|nr:6-pyruvoyl-tetrahydropterin synthase-related protein [Pyrinomonadaceae bacterium]
GNIYPAWQHLSNAGYGDGSFRIYPPLIYFTLSGIRLFAVDWMFSFQLLVVLMSAAGSFLSFYWLRGFASQTQALLGASLFCFAPFRINELYQSAMLSQFAAAAFLLLLLGVVERLADERLPLATVRRLRVLFAVGSACLILTHVPVAMMAALTIPLYAALRFERKIRLHRLLTLGMASAIGLCLSAFYWLNLVLELPLVKGATIQPGRRFDYRANFAFSSATQDQNGWYVNLLCLATMALIVPAVMYVSVSFRSREHKRWMTTSIVLALATLLMTTGLSAPLWKVIPKLSAIEFPWRWLSASSIFVAGLAGVSLPLLWQSSRSARSRPLLLLAAGGVVIALTFSCAYPIRNALFVNRDAFTALLQNSRTSTSLEEWLPRSTTLDAANRLGQQDASLVNVAGRTALVQSWGAETRRFTVGAGEAAAAQIHTFFYPYWQLRTADGKALPTHPDADGVLLADIPVGPQTIQMQFIRPAHQTVANILSLAGVAILAASFGVRRKPKR